MTFAALTPDLCTVRDLFAGDTAYSVPVYQRSFAWQAEQIEQLIADVADAQTDGSDGYFLGNLVVTPLAGKRDLSVVDGQQRLTTLYLLLTYLLRTSEHEHPQHTGRLRYESRPRSSETLRRIDGGYPEQSVRATPESELEQGIVRAFNVIEQTVQQKFTASQQAAFLTYLLDSVQVVRVTLPDRTDLNRYFEIMNTRGQQLEQVDIVKARLMATLDEGDRACFAWVWDACADMDSYVQRSIALGDAELRTALFGDTWTWLAPTDFDELHGIHQRLKQAAPGAIRPSGSMTLSQAIDVYAQSAAEAPADPSETDRFRSTIEFPSLLLHVLKVFLSESGESEGALDDKQLIKRFNEVFKQRGPADVRRFCFTLLHCRHSFDTFVLKREHLARYEDDGEWSLQRALKRTSGGRHTLGYAHTFQRGSTDDEAVDGRTQDLIHLQSMLRVTYTSPRIMHWITLVLRHLHSRDAASVTAEELVDLLCDYARGKVSESFFTATEPQGFEVPRIVFTYLDYVLLKEHAVDGFSRDFDFGFRTSIEHFYPQQPDAEQTGSVVSSECLNLLGNLALVSVSANSKFSNSLPRSKAFNFTDTIERQSPKLALMAQITREQGWNDHQIREHHDAMRAMLQADLQ